MELCFDRIHCSFHWRWSRSSRSSYTRTIRRLAAPCRQWLDLSTAPDNENTSSKFSLPRWLISTRTRCCLDSGDRCVWTGYRWNPSVACGFMVRQSDMEDNVSSERQRRIVPASPASLATPPKTSSGGVGTRPNVVSPRTSSSAQTRKSWLAGTRGDWSEDSTKHVDSCTRESIGDVRTSAAAFCSAVWAQQHYCYYYYYCIGHKVIVSDRNGYPGTRSISGYPGGTQYPFRFSKMAKSAKIRCSCIIYVTFMYRACLRLLSLPVTFYRRACLLTTTSLKLFAKSGKLTLPLNRFVINFETAVTCLC